MTEPYRTIDHAPLSVNQASIILLLLIGFIFSQPWLVALVAFAMLFGTVARQPGFGFLYTLALKPAGWVKPDVFPDHPEPHRFAQGFGGLVALGGAAALFAGATVLGWALTWVVIVLATVNLLLGFCAGCAVYYWLNALKAPGFTKSAPAGFFPGVRPTRRQP